MKKRRTKAGRMLALFLAVVMGLTMTSTVGFAAEPTDQPADPQAKDEVNLLILGDSTTSGYRLPDFLNSNSGFSLYNNYLDTWWTKEAAIELRDRGGRDKGGRMSLESYPWRLKKYIESTEGVDCKLVPMSINGMRTDELRALLDDEYCQKAIKQEEDYAAQIEEEKGITLPYHAGFLRKHMDWITEDLYDGVQNYDGFPNIGEPPITEMTLQGAQNYMAQAITDADIIILDCATNNFGTYNGGRISAYLGLDNNWWPNTLETIEDVDELPDSIRSRMIKLRDSLLESSDMFENGAARQLLEMYIYDLADCAVNYTADMEMIRELNPEAKILSVGLCNPMEGLSISSGGEKIDMGEITGELFKLYNTYIRGLDKNADNVYYVDIFTNNVTTFTKQVVNSTIEELLADTDMENGKYGNYLINYLTQGLGTEMMKMDISDIEGNPLLKEVLMEMVYESLKNHGDLDVESVSKAMEGDNYNQTTQIIGNYVTAKVVEKNVRAGVIAGYAQYGIEPTEEQIAAGIEANWPEPYEALRDARELDEAYWCLLNIYNRFILSNGIGLHPNKDGCAEKYDAVLKTYQKSITDPEATAYAEYMAGWKDKIEELRALLNGTPVGDDLEAAIEKINKANEIMALLEEEGLTADKLKELLSMKEELEQRVQMVLDAFDTNMDEVIALADEITSDPAKMDELVNKVNQLKEVMAIIDEENLTPDQLRQLFQTKKDLEDKVTKILAEFDMTIDDLAAMLDEATSDPEKMAELIKKFNQINAALELMDEEGLTADQLKALLQAKKDLEARITDALAVFGLTLDDLYEAAMNATEPENLAKLAEQVAMLQDLINRIPKTKEEAKAELLKQLDNIEALLEENAIGISDDLLAQLKAINALLKQAVTEEDFNAIAEQLLPIGQKLLAIGEAVAGLPEYEAAMEEYMKANDAAMAALQDKVDALEDLEIQLLAKSIKPKLETEVTFPNHTAMATVSWDADEDAAGYVFKRNGQEADFAATENGWKYEDTAVQVGETYVYEVTPYVIGKAGEQVFGKTFKTTVIPEVTVDKVKLGKVKKGTKSFKASWKEVADADGYEISYKVGKATKTKDVSAEKLTVKVKKLKAGKKYTVKVRAYRTVNDITYTGAWSKAKKVKTK